MVVLTLFGKRNGETIYFEDPLPKVHFAKLISCSLYNSWNTLKREGTISFGDTSKEKNRFVTKLYPGHYDLKRFAEEIESIVEKNKYGVEIEKNSPLGHLLIKNPKKDFINIDTDLANLFTGGIREIFGNRSNLKDSFIIKRVLYPTTYFVHCDLIDKEQNLFNGKKSDLLARFDITGKPFEKETYNASQQQDLRDCSTDKHVNSITLSVKDQKGELFDFNGFDMEFELELN
jgi:hypothetical protein